MARGGIDGEIEPEAERIPKGETYELFFALWSQTFRVLESTLLLEGKINGVNFQYITSRNDIMHCTKLHCITVHLHCANCCAQLNQPQSALLTRQTTYWEQQWTKQPKGRKQLL